MEPRDKNFDRRCDHRRMADQWVEAQRRHTAGMISLAAEAIHESYPEVSIICLNAYPHDERPAGTPLVGGLWCGSERALDENGQPVQAGPMVAIRHHDGAVTTVEDLITVAFQDNPLGTRDYVFPDQSVFGPHLRLVPGRRDQ